MVGIDFVAIVSVVALPGTLFDRVRDHESAPFLVRIGRAALVLHRTMGKSDRVHSKGATRWLRYRHGILGI